MHRRYSCRIIYKIVMTELIEEVFRRGVVSDEHGNEYRLHSNINRVQGEFIYRLICSDPGIRKTLEVGCAYGVSSLYICSALSAREGAEHIIIDPLQTEDWRRIGVSNLDRAGYDFYKLIEKPSEFALPEIAQNAAGSFDFVFIDGWHTFDQTMLDLYYANRIVKVGGYIAMDDCSWSSIAKALSYFSNYPCYRGTLQGASKKSLKRVIANFIKTILPHCIAGNVLPRSLYDRFYLRTVYPSLVALKKTGDDRRDYTWFEPF